MAPIQIPDGMYSFTAKGPDGNPITFELDLVEAHEKINAIGAETRAAQLSNFEHVHRFAQWVKETAGATLKTGQADYLIDAILCEYAKQKKEVRVLLESANSTAQAPVS